MIKSELRLKDVNRIFTLGNPIPKADDPRVLTISAKSIYTEQAAMLVRGKTRSLFASYKDFDSAFEAFTDDSDAGLNKKLLSIVVNIFKEQNIPLKIVGLQTSNLKPDEEVWRAQIQIQSAQAQIDSITKIGNFLNAHPEMRDIYKFTVLKELAQTSSEKGGNFMYLMDISGGNAPIPFGS